MDGPDAYKAGMIILIIIIWGIYLITKADRI